eukprot:364526-Chlamydomonas_euryale.AAC.3
MADLEAERAKLGGAEDIRLLFKVYSAVFEKGTPRSASDSDKRMRQDLLSVLMDAQEPLPHAMLQQMGLGPALQQLPGWGVLFYLVRNEGRRERKVEGRK